MGIDPFHFTLPHSRYIFIIEPVVDLTNSQTSEDFFHTDVEVEIHPSLDSYLRYENSPSDIPLEKQLTQYDPFFQKVMEMIE